MSADPASGRDRGLFWNVSYEISGLVEGDILRFVRKRASTFRGDVVAQVARNGGGLASVKPESPDVGESVLSRAARILNAFHDGDLVLSLGQLAERSGLPKSTVHRLAEQLHELGWLERETGGYRVGIRLFEIGGLVGRRSRLRDIAVPHLQELSRSTGLAVQLAILDGGEVVYLERVLVRGFKLPTRDGGRMPAHCTGLGKVLLAYGPPANVELVLAQGLERRTAHTIVDTDAFLRELEQIREEGIAHDREEGVRGIVCVAAPVRGSGLAVGAVSVTGPIPGFDDVLAAAGARRAAAGIWRDMFGSAYAT